jgi:hypothetical protein
MIFHFAERNICGIERLAKIWKEIVITFARILLHFLIKNTISIQT